MPDCTDRIGPAKAPAPPASTEPSRTSSVFSRSTLAPSTLAMGALLAPARISMPKRPVDGIVVAEQADRPFQRLGHRRVIRPAAPDDRGQLVEEHHQPERGQHLVQVVVPVQRTRDQPFQHHAHESAARHRGQDGERERAAGVVGGGPQEGPDHVERAMRQVDEVHDAEDQGR
ncbi:hypothetical protein G6F57_019925 [Rhizopus arrhizus]|nr:hypothetical protein G6F57_019925 [Rhizopus arrhizus]